MFRRATYSSKANRSSCSTWAIKSSGESSKRHKYCKSHFRNASHQRFDIHLVTLRKAANSEIAVGGNCLSEKDEQLEGRERATKFDILCLIAWMFRIMDWMPCVVFREMVITLSITSRAMYCGTEQNTYLNKQRLQKQIRGGRHLCFLGERKRERT